MACQGIPQSIAAAQQFRVGLAAPAPVELVQVSRVLSGQTIEVLNKQNALTERVRLLGIESPNWQQQKRWSEAAKQQLTDLIGQGKTVQLESDIEPDYTNDKGSKIRLAYVWQGDQLLNEALVAGGFVLARSHSPNTKYEQRLTYAQEKARLLGMGIWNPQDPMRQDPDDF